MQIIRVDIAGLSIAISLMNPIADCDISCGPDGFTDDGLILYRVCFIGSANIGDVKSCERRSPKVVIAIDDMDVGPPWVIEGTEEAEEKTRKKEAKGQATLLRGLIFEILEHVMI